jgi:TPR repeat protein
MWNNPAPKEMTMFRPALLLSALLFALPVTVLADELADGIRAWERQDYRQAHAIFSKLAAAGNPEAQRQLGEMVSVTEFAAAKGRMDQLYTAMAADAKQQAIALVAANDAWVKETEVYAKGQKLSNDHDIDELRRIKLARRYGAKSVKPVTAPPPAPSTGR